MSSTPPAVPGPHVDLSPFRNLARDVPAGVVVFLVALPLCLGVALASGAPLLSGLVAGIAGGLVIPLVSRSALSVSGPAAGLTAVVAAGITQLGSFEAVCLATVVAGLLQIGLGLARAGVIASFIPSAVIRGMLAAIGVLLVLKQFPHAIGFDTEAFETDAFELRGGGNTFTQIVDALSYADAGAVLVSAVSLAILVAYERSAKLKSLTLVPGPLVVVLVGTAIQVGLRASGASLALSDEHLVQVPAGPELARTLRALAGPSPAALTHASTWTFALTLAIVASLETLLSLDAIDKLDPFRRRSDPNRELLAQGLANATSGLLGGLPVTSVIVRSSANVNAGARTRASAFVHGALLLLAVAFAGDLLGHIPLAALATILLVTGYKLAKPALFVAMAALGPRQFVPFVTTVVAIVATDLLRGIVFGIVVGLGFTLREAMRGAFDRIEEAPSRVRIVFRKDVHFFHRAAMQEALDATPDDTVLVVDKGAADFVERDVLEAICEFRSAARARGVEVELVGLEPVAPLGGH